MTYRRIALATSIALVLVLATVPAALAGKGHGGTASSCTPNAPGVAVQNHIGWNQTGSWALQGQRLGFQFRSVTSTSGAGQRASS
jgi:hypothetical protein